VSFFDRLARHNGPFIAKALRALAQWLEHLFPGPAVVAVPVIFSLKGVTAVGEITVTTDDSSVNASVSYLDAKGNQTSPADVPVWESSDPDVASVEGSADGMSAVVTPLSSGEGAGGAAAVISVVAHDDDDEEVRSEGTITVRPGDAVIGEITFQAPTEGGGGSETPPDEEAPA
jgi:hypothetical protein